MAAPKNGAQGKLFEDMKEQNTQIKYLPSFKNPGDFIRGIYLGTVESHDQKTGKDQINWLVDVAIGYIQDKDIEQGIYRMSEKAQMASARLNFSEGDEFGIQFIEEIQIKDRKVKNFKIYKK